VKERSRVRWACRVITSLLLSSCLLALLPHQPILAQGTGWSEPVLLSTNTVWSCSQTLLWTLIVGFMLFMTAVYLWGGANLCLE